MHDARCTYQYIFKNTTLIRQMIKNNNSQNGTYIVQNDYDNR